MSSDCSKHQFCFVRLDYLLKEQRVLMYIPPCIPGGGVTLLPHLEFLLRLFLLFNIFPSIVLFLNISVMEIH